MFRLKGRKKKQGEKPEYMEQDKITEVKDKRYSESSRPVWKEDKLEKIKNQPHKKSKVSQKEVRQVEKNGHGRSDEIEPPDEEAVEKRKGNLPKKDRKKMAVMIITKKMKKKKMEDED